MRKLLAVLLCLVAACQSGPATRRETVRILNASANDLGGVQVGVASCGGKPSATVVESMAEVRVTVRSTVATNGNSAACADGLTLVLQQPLGARRLVDGKSGKRITPRQVEPLPHAAIAVVPTVAQIHKDLMRTGEVGATDVSFDSGDDPGTTIGDGRGGWLTAVGAVRTPNGDGRGQAVFFWHGKDLVGVAPRHEALTVVSIGTSGHGLFDVTYAVYRPQDALCCPKQLVTVTYRWNGTTMVATKPEPADVFDGTLTVTLR